jgi:hypothetical protein
VTEHLAVKDYSLVKVISDFLLQNDYLGLKVRDLDIQVAIYISKVLDLAL